MYRHFGTITIISGLGMLVACSNNDSSNANSIVEPSTNEQYSEITLNATAGGFSADPTSAGNKAAYINFATGEVLELSDIEAQISTDWHMALKRTDTFFNGGHSGLGNVQSAIIETQDNYYDGEGNADQNVFLNSSAIDEEAIFINATVDDQDFSFDSPKPAISSDGTELSWWSYDPSTHTLAAAPENWSIIRGASGDSFAKVHVTAIDTAARAINLEFFVQAQGSNTFDTTATQWLADMDDAAGGTLCWDIDNGAEVDCDASADVWDLRADISADGRAWTLWSNGGAYGDGASGAVLNGLDATTVASYSSASEVPGFFSDSMSNAVKDNPWYAYNLQEQHKLWPNYRVYAVDIGGTIYKVQFTSYYHPETGVSGYITLRYLPVE